MRPDELSSIIGRAEQVADILRQHAGLTQSTSLDWARLSPQQFEDLCYDVLLRWGRFDETTIRKHGKTHSRDGGRDIEAWTLQRVGHPPEKWIFQCKFTNTGNAVGASKVMVADIVDQYGAAGFGVLTNGLIDSTLYDKLDAIAARRKLTTDTWDGRRLQRFLAARPDLMQHYFPSTRPA
jgi:hypothetical protein